MFKQIVELIKNKEHLSIEGLTKIINIKASLNSGLSEILKTKFNNINPVERPIINTTNIPETKWLIGLTSGEGNFDVRILKSKTTNTKYIVQLRFRVSQHSRDLHLMELLIKYLRTGKLEKNNNDSVISLTVYKFSVINNIIIPFFSKYSLLGIKQLDYIDFFKVANLMKEKKNI